MMAYFPNYQLSSNSQFLSDPERSHPAMYYPPHLFQSSQENFPSPQAMYYPSHLFQSSQDWGHENFPTSRNGLPPPGTRAALNHAQHINHTHHINQRIHNNDYINEGLHSLPSPPVTFSGSEMSSPGGNYESASASPQTLRPSSAKSPYEWMKKTPFNQPNTGTKTRTKDKYRVVYTEYQRLELEKEFHTSRYITIRRKSELAQTLQLSERQVKIWFQNRRAKERKTQKKGSPDTKPKIEPGHSLHHMSMGQLHYSQHYHSHHFNVGPPPPQRGLP